MSDSSNDAHDEPTVTTGRITNVNELTDLIARKKAEVERLTELERDRMQLL